MGLEYATLTPGTGAAIPVLFNPSEYTVRKNVSYAEIAVPGLNQPLLQFVRGDSEVFSTELFLDSSDSPYPSSLTRGVTTPAPDATALDMRAKLHALTQVDGELHAPPVVTFTWSTFVFRGVVTSLTERFVLFDERGNAWRIRVQLEMKRFEEPDLQRRTINPQSPDRTKTHVVREGDTLSRIAAAEYGDPAAWRRIAEANGLERPRQLVPGAVLLVPAV
jgi:nucleoid-associated protein YgaU